MIKLVLLSAAFAVTTLVSAQAHCGNCDQKDCKKGDKKDDHKKELVTKIQP